MIFSNSSIYLHCFPLFSIFFAENPIWILNEIERFSSKEVQTYFTKLKRGLNVCFQYFCIIILRSDYEHVINYETTIFGNTDLFLLKQS